jgi:hypothetical protein
MSALSRFVRARARGCCRPIRQWESCFATGSFAHHKEEFHSRRNRNGTRQFSCTISEDGRHGVPHTLNGASHLTRRERSKVHSFSTKLSEEASANSDVPSSPPPLSQITPQEETDMFGESVTLLTHAQGPTRVEIEDAMSALDEFQIGIVSRGKSFSDGGDSEGEAPQACHASAIAWSALLRQARKACVGLDSSQEGRSTCDPPSPDHLRCEVPMLVVAAVTPLLVHTGLPYLRYLDRCIQRYTTPGDHDNIHLENMAHCALHQLSAAPHMLPLREQIHLEALGYLLEQKPRHALRLYMRLLCMNPGDALAISLCMDLCQALGDTKAAMYGVCSVARYHAERNRPAAATSALSNMTDIVNAWVALGLAVGAAPGGGGGGGSDGSGQSRSAELLAETCHSRAMLHHTASLGGGVATWALAHVYDSGGRMAEGVSHLSSFDGKEFYRECGWLNFHAKLAGYGARFVLDRDGKHGGNSALRVYDEYFHSFASSRLEDYGNPKVPLNNWIVRRAPHKMGSVLVRAVTPIKNATRGLFGSLFGNDSDDKSGNPPRINGNDSDDKSGNPPQINGNDLDSKTEKEIENASPLGKAELDDILTNLPPTPQFLTDATLLLLRMTLAGVVTERDERWVALRHAWVKLYNELSRDSPQDVGLATNYENAFLGAPFAAVVGSLLLHPSDCEAGNNPLLKGVSGLGRLMKLGGVSTDVDYAQETEENAKQEADIKTISPEDQALAKEVVTQLSSALPGRDVAMETSTVLYAGWEIDWRPILEHGLCHAAVLSKDYECFSIARSVCSEGVTLRPNSPETWWRYSVVLEEIGDEHAAEDARQASISFSSGVRSLSSTPR